MIAKGILLFILSLFLMSEVNAQSPTWRTLPGAPVGAPSYPKIVDCSFINETTGWLVMIENSVGKAYKTVNGGYNWTLRYSVPGKTFRSVAFLNEDIIIIGTLNNTIYRSTNGGDNWSVVHTTSSGICGLFSPDGQTVYGCGRYYSPARFYRSSNQGANWTEINMSSYAFGLVDLYFYSLDSGYVIGGKGTSLQTSKSIVLFTSDGGDTWEERFLGTGTKQWGWKIEFPSRDTGYASVEKAIFLSDSIPAPYLKTTDGGITWIEKDFLPTPYDQEGIGFINNTTGWLGGWGDDDDGPTYKTTDGGDSWVLDDWSRNFNRFRFINDTVSYAVGKTVYKYSKDSTVSINIVSSEIPTGYNLFQNYPNPFNPATKIKFSVMSGDKDIILKVFDLSGKEMSVVAFGKFQPGTYEVLFDGSSLPSGVYFYELTSGTYKEVKKMVLVK